MTSRVAKKLMPHLDGIEGAIIVVNALDPQFATVSVFLDAVEHLSHITLLNKCDLIEKAKVPELRAKLKGEIIPASIIDGRGVPELEYRLAQWRKGIRVVVLGVFNAGKTSLINALTGSSEPTDDIPGTTLTFKEHGYKGITLIDSLGMITDISKPKMISVDLEGCLTLDEKLERVLRVDASAILESIVSASEGLIKAVPMIVEAVKAGRKVITCGAGASALVAKEMAGQAQETGVPVMVFTNDLAMMQPVSFAKGLGEDEGALADYIALAANEGDVVIGVSASGGTGFVFTALEQARLKGAKTIAITENSDTPLGKVANVIIKSEGKPEGPSSAPVQIAHFAIGHALMLAVADERGVDAEAAVNYMLAKILRNKTMGNK